MSGFYRGVGGTGDATGDTVNATTASIAARDAALAAQAAAETASAAASASQTSASTSASSTSTSATNAANSASSASTSASNAAASASTATTQAGIATTQASNASASASSASTSASTATSAASTATTQASNASTSATNAAASEANSLANKNAAATSATNASTSASAAATSATAAASSATSAASSAAAASAVALGNEPVRHSVRPSLLLDFANTKQLDPRITFSRPTTATYYDEKTVAKAEENLLTYSQTYTNAAWIVSNTSVTGNSIAAPDGTTTGSTITGDGVSALHSIRQSVTTTGTGTFSVYAKAGTNNYIQFLNDGTASYYCNFDLSVGTAYPTGCTATITSAGGGWYLCTVTYTSAVAGTLRIALVSATSSVRAETNTLATTVYLWGSQVENRSSVTAYTPTTTAAITNYIPVLQTATANSARFDHNPTTGESLGLLIEEQRTNLITYSDDFSNAAWSKFASSITSNSNIAPDGTLTADIFKADGTSAIHRINQTATAGAKVFSIYVKASSNSFIQILWDVDAAPYANFDLINGVVGTFGTATTASIQSVGNGWYRCIAYTSSSTATNPNFALVSSSSATRGESNSLSTSVFIWGAQLEAGSFATSYIPTVASQVTRSADSASMTGTNFSSWYRTEEGTFYINGIAGQTAYRTLIDGSVASNQVYLSNASTAPLNYASSSSSTTVATGTTVLAAVVFSQAGTANTLNSGSVVTNTTIQTPYTQLFIGRNRSSGEYWNSTFKRIAYYPKRLTNAELQGLTTV